MAVNSALLAKTGFVSRAVRAAGRKGAGGERAVSGRCRGWKAGSGHFLNACVSEVAVSTGR